MHHNSSENLCWISVKYALEILILNTSTIKHLLFTLIFFLLLYIEMFKQLDFDNA